MKRYLILFLIVALVAAETEFDYCTMNCRINGTEVKHVRCDNNGELGSNCKHNYSVVNFDEPSQKVILHEHNILRNFVAGGANATYKYKPACRMGTMQWNGDLTTNSVLFIKKCNYDGGYCLGTIDFPNSGYFRTPYLTYPINTTAIEVFQEYLSQFTKQPLGLDFTDLFADRNIRLGCSGIYRYIKEGKRLFHFICIYATDIADRESMYAECEKPATGCKTGTNEEYPNLCSIDEQYENE